MSESIDFQDYILAGVQESVRGDSPAREWALARTKVLKSLRGLGARRTEWIRQFAASVQFSGDEDAFIAYIIGYVLTAGVSLNVETGLFTANARVSPGPLHDTALQTLLENQQKMISDLHAQVASLTSAPAKQEIAIPPLSLKALYDLHVAYNHPQWVVRMIWFLRAMVLRLPIPQREMRMSDKWGDEQQRALLLEFSDAQKANDTMWTDLKPDGDDVAMAGGSSDKDLGKANPSAGPDLPEGLVQMTEAMWLLTYTAVHKYKEKYESDATQSKQVSSNSVFTEGLTPAGARIKKIMAKRFRIQDGVEFFEVHKNEWVQSSDPPVGPCKTCREKGKIECHWVWQCPLLE